MTKFEITIEGQPYSKSNSRQIGQAFKKGGGRQAILTKSPEGKAYSDHATLQAHFHARNTGHEMFMNPVVLEATIYYKSRRPDLDESLIMDVLEKAGVYKNDRQVYEKHIYKRFDKENPRAEISVYELGDVEK